RRAALGCAFVVILVLVAAVTAGAAPHRHGPRNGSIAFSSDRDGDNEIYAMRPDGTHVRQLTHNSANDYAPAYSPDGRSIAFVSSRDGDFEIFSMRRDGSRQRQLTHNDVYDDDP